jgi:hypothetical protein
MTLRSILDASVRAIFGSFAGVILTPLALILLLQSSDLEDRPWVLYVIGLGTILGAIVGALLGQVEIRGVARLSLIGSLWGSVIGTLVGYSLGSAMAAGTPFLGVSYINQGVVIGALCGAVLGGIAGRVRHGGRVTLGEILVVVAIAALVSALIRLIAR